MIHAFLILKVLLGCGKTISGKVLPAAASNGRTSYIKHVVEKIRPTVDIDHTDKAGRSALLKAAENGHLEIIKFLISNRADLRHTDRYI